MKTDRTARAAPWRRASSRAARVARALTPLITLVALVSCSSFRATEAESTSADEHSVGASIRLSGDADEDALERGKQKARAGEWSAAIDSYSRVYENVSAKTEYRIAALFELGQVYTNVLNPGRDEERAAQYFQKLVREFPESEQRALAEQRLRELQPSE